jgi:tryptophan aminotransferase
MPSVNFSTLNVNGTGCSRPSLPPSYYKRYISNAAKARKSSPIHDLLHLEFRPGMISLLTGKPNPGTFPFRTLSFTSQDPEDHTKTIDHSLDPSLLADGLQYGPTNGLPRFIKWVTSLQEREHGRSGAGEGWRVSVGTGSMDMINKAVVTMINPGDYVLIERPVYA